MVDDHVRALPFHVFQHLFLEAPVGIGKLQGRQAGARMIWLPKLDHAPAYARRELPS